MFQKISGSEKVYIRGGGEYQDFPSKVFCLTLPKIFVGEPFSVSLISGIEKDCASEGYVTIFDFLSKVFCLTVPKNFVEEPFCAVFQKISGSEKVYMRGGEYQDFPSKVFCLTVPKIFEWESFSVALISGTEKVWRRGGGISSFCVENFLSHSAENFRRGILYCCINFGYRKRLEKRGGGYQVFTSKLFCLTMPKISVGESFAIALISAIEKVWIREGGGEYQDFLSEIFCLTVPKISVGNPLLLH